MHLFSRKNHFPVEGRTVVITGGSQGMGRSVARQLAAKGADIVIVARNVEKLKAAVEYVAGAACHPNRQRFHYISADLQEHHECVRVLSEVKSWNGNRAPDIVWCVAGSAYPEFFIDTDVARLREQMDQNYWSTAYIAHAALRDWLRPGDSSASASDGAEPRHLIFTSSVVTFCSLAGYAPYAPAKAALRSLSDALQQELTLYNASRKHASRQGPAAEVQIHNICPGTILSPGLEQENLTKPAITFKLEEGDTAQTEDEVAAMSIRGLERGEYLITTSFVGSLMRAASWASSPRNNWLRDTLVSWLSNVVWIFVRHDMERKLSRWGAEHGHPAAYKKTKGNE
ncbi:MAG: 3-dehydrosphinganine reductase [Peltula sp. TS41687]|nr:MAG: 3-dehydrosphinganine reductase [Peltula sp. TS41687]